MSDFTHENNRVLLSLVTYRNLRAYSFCALYYEVINNLINLFALATCRLIYFEALPVAFAIIIAHFSCLLSIIHSQDSLLPGNKLHAIDFEQSRPQLWNSEWNSEWTLKIITFLTGNSMHLWKFHSLVERNFSVWKCKFCCALEITYALFISPLVYIIQNECFLLWKSNFKRLTKAMLY